MISAEVRVNGKQSTCKINPHSSIKSIKEYICKELELNPTDYYLTVSSLDESINISDIVKSNCIIEVNKNVIVDKSGFVDIK